MMRKQEQKNTFRFRDTVNGMDIQWEYTENIRSFAILILGAGGACMLCISDRQRRKENEKRKMIQMKNGLSADNQ